MASPSSLSQNLMATSPPSGSVGAGSLSTSPVNVGGFSSMNSSRDGVTFSLRSSGSSHGGKNSPHGLEKCVGMRREDKNRWERRAPMAPSHVAQLVKQGFRVIVQPSTLRTFADVQYEEAGAEIDEDLTPCNTIMAVKEVPAELLIPNRTYVFFSHTIKAQAYNMALLDTLLEKKVRLIDYELIVDDTGNRLVRFGKFAGFAGMVDTLHSIGDRLLAKRHSTPFLHVGMSYVYSSVQTAKDAVAAAGEEIANYGLPQELVPMTFCFTSKGNVSQGALEVFRQLPHEMVSPEEMVELAQNPERASRFKVYGTVITAEDFSEKIDGGDFDKAEYYDHPELYRSTFHEKFAPHISVLMNCMYWDYQFPRLLTNKQMLNLVEEGRSRLLCVGDISADPGGSVEFLIKTTSIDNPTFVYDPYTGELYDNENDNEYMYRDGILFCAVDNFPTEFPKEATQYFGDHLAPFLADLIDSHYDGESEPGPLPKEIEAAVELENGALRPAFEYIMELRKRNDGLVRSILVVGSGHVSGPCIDYFLRNPNNTVTVADMDLESATRRCKGHPNASAVGINIMTDTEALSALVKRHNIVISLLPAPLTINIAKLCVEHGSPMVSASYISDEVRALDAEAKAAGVLLLNEVGLDPGIDHLEALRVIDDIHLKGGKVRSFVSWCGGLPLPEASSNPFAYKFSWAPRGVLTAAQNPAKYLQDGRIVEVDGQKLLEKTQPVDIFPGFSFEGFPNRDATKYLDMYGVRDEVKTFFRGTLRFEGFAAILRAFNELGLLNAETVDWLPREGHENPAAVSSWSEAMRRLMPEHARRGVPTKKALHRRLQAQHKCFPSKGHNRDAIHRILKCVNWLGLFDESAGSIATTRSGSPLDALCAVMQDRMKYKDNESDLVVLHHMFEIEWPYKETNEIRTSTLVQRGRRQTSKKPGMLAMAQTVGTPAAIAADLILSGDLVPQEVTPDRLHTNRTDDSNVGTGPEGDKKVFCGVMSPTFRELYVPLMAALEREGIQFVEEKEEEFF